jgi:hypothetical protein
MKKQLPARSYLLLPALVFSLCQSSVTVSAQPLQMSAEQQLPEHFDVSPPLNELPLIPPSEAAPTGDRPLGRTLSFTSGPLAPLMVDPVLQSSVGPLVAAVPALTSFDGLGFGFPGFTCPTGNCFPPDPNGAVGAFQYVEWVNRSFAVFSKTTGALLYGPAAGNTLWQGFGGMCETHNDGDPIVLYDHLAHRWVMTQFAWDDSSHNYLLCIAVSRSPDATTAQWNRYSYTMPSCPDYTKVGIWPNGYFTSSNMYTRCGPGKVFTSARASAFDRNAMIAGTSAAMHFTVVFGAYESLLPSDLDGPTLPPAGSPNYFVNIGPNALNLWRYYIDYSNPDNSFLDGPFSVSNVAPFTPGCNGFPRNECIPQAGTATLLDSIGDRLMFRLPYRRFPDHEVLVATHTVEASATTHSTGIRWYEIRNPGGSPAVVQQGTFAPDGRSRWVPSIAMDRRGDIAVGYSHSGSTSRPGIRYTGRVPTDTPGTLQSETTIITGNGSNTSISRWGDYTSMSVDPVFDCTFWYVNQYLPSTGSGTSNWRTHIAPFRFLDCVPCIGDCDHGGQVTVDELLRGISYALGGQLPDAPDTCYPADGNSDRTVFINELVAATDNLIRGCGSGGAGGGQGGSGVTITIGSTTGPRGATVAIPVALSDGAVAGAQVDIVFNTSVLSISNPSSNCSLGAAPAETGAHTLLVSTPTMPAPPAGHQRLRLLIIPSFASSSIATFNPGTMASCNFTIGTEAPLGPSSLLAQLPGASDTSGNEIVAVGQSGQVTVQCGPCGC